MKILAIESSAGPASVAVGENDRLIAHYYENCGYTHSKTIMPMIMSMLENIGMTADDIDAIAVAAGPGSFTGVRIGVSAAKGLSWAKNKPCIAVSALHAMSMNVLFWGGIICAVMDARRDQVYNALFSVKQGEILRLCPDRAVSLEELAQELPGYKKEVMLVGDGADLCYNYFKGCGIRALKAPDSIIYQNAAGVFYSALRKIAENGITDTYGLMPVYLRNSQAQREREEKLLKEGNENV